MKLFQRKKKYSKISYQKRITLIKLIEEEKLTILRAAKRLHIKVPTAKIILSNYRKKGQIFNKKMEQRKQEPENHEIKTEQLRQIQLPEESIIPEQPFFYYYMPFPMNFISYC